MHVDLCTVHIIMLQLVKDMILKLIVKPTGDKTFSQDIVNVTNVLSTWHTWMNSFIVSWFSDFNLLLKINSF